jgi:MFS family permease
MEAFLGSSVVLGMTIGAVCGGILMKIGRRKALILCCLLGIVATGVTIIPRFYPDNEDGSNDTNFTLNYILMLGGRFFFGISVGLISSICPRFLEETIPNHLYD